MGEVRVKVRKGRVTAAAGIALVLWAGSGSVAPAADLSALSAWAEPRGEWTGAVEVTLDPEDPKKLAWQGGQGAFVNGAGGRTVNLLSAGSFGDVEAQIEFVVPQGSNSGVYFMGRYEIQILDSWGVEKPKHGDVGGIYQRWDEGRDRKGFEGRPPRVNAARRPGQWQRLDVVFRAPRFDPEGRKTANARFDLVLLNGQIVHENQEVGGPTRAASFGDEQPTGPLMLQGDHGPVAYRNIHLRPIPAADDLKALAGAGFPDLLGYTFGQSRAAFSAVEERIRGASPVERAVIETGLLNSLRAPDATDEARRQICRLLRLVATERAIPPLTPLLIEPEMSHLARYALQGLPHPAVDAAFRGALERTEGAAQVGLVVSIGLRRDREATDEITRLARSRDPALAGAAVTALGHIGGPGAARALLGLDVSPGLRGRWHDALLRAAASLTAGGERADAARIYTRLSGGETPAWVAAAAARGLVLAGGEKAVPRVLEMLADGDPALQLAATQLVAEIPGAAATRAFIDALSGLGPTAQVALIGALADRGDRAAVGAIESSARSRNEDVQIAAARALGVLGGGDAIPMLLSLARPERPTAAAAARALASVGGEGAAEKIRSEAVRGKAPIRAAAIRALVDRRDSTNLLDLLPGVLADDEGIRQETVRALGQLSQDGHIGALLHMLTRVDDERTRAGIEKAILAAALGSGRRPGVAAELAGAAGELRPAERASVLRVLGRLGGPAALEASRAALASGDPSIVEAGTRALAGWPDAAAVPHLQTIIAAEGTPATSRALAFRGLVRLLRASQGSTAENFKQALARARDAGEKRQVLSALGATGQPWALDLLAPLLDDDELKADAAAAHTALEAAVAGIPILADRLELQAVDATIKGNGAVYEAANNRRCIGSYSNPFATVHWSFLAAEPGTYEVAVSQSMASQPGTTYEVHVGGQKLSGTVISTGDWARFELVPLGKIKIDQPGKTAVSFKPVKKAGPFVINLRAVLLTRAE